MSTDFPINITQIERFLAFLLIISNVVLAGLRKTKNHKFWDRAVEVFLEKRKRYEMV